MRPNQAIIYLNFRDLKKRFVLNIFNIIFNSRTAIAGAIIDLLSVFYNPKNLNCIGALSFFYICLHIFMIFEVKLE